MKIILHEQARIYLESIKWSFKDTEDTSGVFFDGESYCWVGYKIKNGNFDTATFDTHEQALKFVIR